jgi:EAL domain-containing protein (putative c-di-GMP-specific phosphodiesterase class I)
VLDGAGAEADRLPDFDRLPVHGIKLDRSVVTLLDRSADRRSLVRSLVERAREKGVTVTGVGIETLEQAERLWDLGADTGQGPLFFRPIQEEQLPALFATEPTLVAAD